MAVVSLDCLLIYLVAFFLLLLQYRRQGLATHHQDHLLLAVDLDLDFIHLKLEVLGLVPVSF